MPLDRDDVGIDRAVATIAEVYTFCPAGGALHVVIDDGNVDSVEWCEEHIDDGDHLPERSSRQRAAELACIDALKPLSMKDRERAIFLYHGWGEPTDDAFDLDEDE